MKQKDFIYPNLAVGQQLVKRRQFTGKQGMGLMVLHRNGGAHLISRHLGPEFNLSKLLAL